MAIITITTDFGFADTYVGVMKGVIVSIAPNTSIVDITHGVEPQNIRQCAFLLATAFHYFPPGSIHVAVVDPGVGSGRRPVVIESGEHVFVGPDNGIFTAILSSGSVYNAYEITAKEKMLTPVSATFHGRDIFAPVAAHIANGVPPHELGPKIADPAALELPVIVKHDNSLIRGEIVHIDRFGNAITNIGRSDVETENIDDIKSDAGDAVGILSSYDAAEDERGLNAIYGSWNTVELFVMNGSAQENFGLKIGDTVEVSFR